MYKDCKTEQSAARQRKIEQGLLELMMKNRYEDISVSDLCDYMQIPRKSFYRYFSGKEGALYALLDHTMMEFYEEEYQNHNRGSQLGDLEQYFVFWYNHRKLMVALERSNLSGILVERATTLALKERLMPGYLLKLDPKIQEVAMAFAVCGLLSMVIQWHKRGYSVAPGEMTKIATTLLTRPLINI